MFRCNVCGFTKSKKTLVSEVFQINQRPVLVEDIPAKVCTRCGEETFSRQTTEEIRQMLHGKATPVKSVSIDVFAFAK